MNRNKEITAKLLPESNEIVVKKSSFLKTQLGVFAKKNFEKGQRLFLVKGRIKKTPSIYSFSVDLSKHIEPVDEAGNFEFGHYMNHSCDPNSVVKVVNRVGKVPFIKIIAGKNIKKGEELTFDYSTLEFDTVTKSKCRCGSKICRKVIRGYKDLPKSIAKKYQSKGMIPKYLLEI